MYINSNVIMTTLEFLNRNSNGIINQLNWEEEVYEHDFKKEEMYDNDFMINSSYIEDDIEYNLRQNNKNYSILINDLNLDTIDTISLKINYSNELYKILFTSYYISMGISNISKIIDTHLFNLCLLSYINNYDIIENNNAISIPIIQFNQYKNGLVYKKNSKIYFSFKNKSSDQYFMLQKNESVLSNSILQESDIINDIKIVFHGKKYYNNTEVNPKEFRYNPIDMYWCLYMYKESGIFIDRIESNYKFISFSLIKCFDCDTILSTNEINEYMNNQPEIEQLLFQYEDTIPWEYDLKYMKKIVLFGINTYIVPLYSEFINTNNILYYLRNSKNSIKPYIEPYKIIIKTNMDNVLYKVYMSFFGEWVSD